MRDFIYHRPATLDEASRLASEAGAAFLAGGQSLILDLRARRRSPASVVDLADVLPRGIEPDVDGSIVIGAGATHSDIASSPVVRSRLPFLASLAGHVGDPAVRHRGTVGGAIALNDPAGDWPAACLALEAEIQTTVRRLRADEFFKGRGLSALDPGEIVLEITFRSAERGAYLKLLNPASRYAIVGVFLALTASGPRVAVTGASVNGAFRWREAEQPLAASLDGAIFSGLKPRGIEFRDDFFADAAYRAHLASVLARRTLESALKSLPSMVSIVHGAPMKSIA